LDHPRTSHFRLRLRILALVLAPVLALARDSFLVQMRILVPDLDQRTMTLLLCLLPSRSWSSACCSSLQSSSAASSSGASSTSDERSRRRRWTRRRQRRTRVRRRREEARRPLRALREVPRVRERRRRMKRAITKWTMTMSCL
ncbi:hypothetical protein PFISCL1PPCAC_21090, partial [Pristionchus fissidentatus]